MLNELEQKLKLKLSEQKLQLMKLEEEYNEMSKQYQNLKIKIPSKKNKTSLFAILIYYHVVLLALPLMIMAGTISTYFFLMLAIIFILNPVFLIYVIKNKYKQKKIYSELEAKETELKELENKLNNAKAKINEYNNQYEEAKTILENKSMNKKQDLEELKKSIVLSTFQPFEEAKKSEKEKTKIIK